MGNALNSATANEYQENRLTKLGELADARYSPETLHHPPSLRALKVQDILMKNAGGKIAEDQWHELDLSTFRHIDGMGNLESNDVVNFVNARLKLHQAPERKYINWTGIGLSIGPHGGAPQIAAKLCGAVVNPGSGV